MKNLTKTVCGIAILLAIACNKENTPAPSITGGSNGTNGINGTNGLSDTIITSDTIVTTGTTTVVHDTVRTEVLYSDWVSPGQPVVTTPTGTPLPGGPGNVPGGTPTTPPVVVMSQNHMFSVKAPAVTQAILDRGIVLAYCRLYDDASFTRPLATTIIVSNYIHIFNYKLSLGYVHFTQFVDNPLGIPRMDNRNKFRYVIIPSTTHVRLSKPLTEMSYDEICEMYHIPK